ncbi:hypothetical protein NFI96_032120 [Prochilodus magdalenae]|nr:hypothetical protein NFI96_032120 [Prochilodus magdalenae]
MKDSPATKGPCKSAQEQCAELHGLGFHGRAAISKPYITKRSAERRVQWCTAPPLDSRAVETSNSQSQKSSISILIWVLALIDIVSSLVSTGSPYYDNVRPLSYPDSDAVLICFDISRPETLDSVLKKWKGEIQEFCPNTKMLLVGCKSDLRTDLTTLVELSNHRQTPVSYDQGSNMAKQISAPYIECSALQSENSVRDIFHVATLACVNKNNKNVKRHKSSRSTKRTSHMPSRPYLESVNADMRKDKAKSCTVM